MLETKILFSLQNRFLNKNKWIMKNKDNKIFLRNLDFKNSIKNSLLKPTE